MENLNHKTIKRESLAEQAVNLWFIFHNYYSVSARVKWIFYV
jgi:hypothetical protein